jgi:LEA14-like dessication related protein
MMNRRWIAGVALVSLIGLPGCKTLARQAFANPVVEVKDVQVKGVGLDGGSLDVILDVYNPNEYRMDATRLTYQVWVDSSELATGAIDRLLTLSEKGHSEVVVPVEFTFAAVRSAMAKFAARGSLDYRVAGMFTYVTPFGNITRPYSGKGRLDSFR